MANKSLFQTLAGALAPKADTVNEAGGLAYRLSPKQALAQYASTGCLSHTYCATAEDQLVQILSLCENVPTDFIARTALHSRQNGFMKDVPALLCAVLAVRDGERLELNPRDSVMSNAQKLASVGGGGTNCSAVLIDLNARKVKADLVIYVSDNESWMDTPHYGRFGGSATRTMQEWMKFKTRNPNARLVCIDIQPYATTQVRESKDFLNIGGFSDMVFSVIAAFARGELSGEHWIGEIEKTAL